jgi:hypothetical protein
MNRRTQHQPAGKARLLIAFLADLAQHRLLFWGEP